MTRKVVEHVSNQQLQQDLEKYRLMAIELGASDAKIITSDMVLVDDRVRAKCINPKCDFYGRSGCCPPHALDLPMVRKIVSSFHYAIFHRIVVPSSVMTWETEEDKTAFRELTARNHEIVSRIESAAFHDAYYLSQGLANGSCKSIFCPTEECSVIKGGQGCRHPFKARSSMEGWGLDVFRMAAGVGWDIYPIWKSVKAGDVPHGSRLGLVLIY